MRTSGKGPSADRVDPESAGDRPASDSTAGNDVSAASFSSAAADSSARHDDRAPTVDQIRARAYELYVERGEAQGDELGDWLRAEREYRERRATRGDDKSRDAREE